MNNNINFNSYNNYRYYTPANIQNEKNLNSNHHNQFSKNIITDGSTTNLKKGETYILPKEGVTLLVGDSMVDLKSSKYKPFFDSLKNGEVLTIGRNNINPNDLKISRSHFQIIKMNNSFYIKDTSTNGTTVIADGKFKNYDSKYLNDTYKDTVNFYFLFNKKYDQIRKANYSDESTFKCYKSQMQEAIDTINPSNFLGCQNGWKFRYIKPDINYNYNSENNEDSIPERISLNVVAHPNLLKELDNLFQYGKYVNQNGEIISLRPNERTLNIDYKTPLEAEEWTKRHDPITIYATTKFTPEMKEAISDITQKYARPSVNGIPLINSLPAKPWISVEKIPQEEDLKELLKKAEKVNPNLANDMCRYSYEGWNHYNGWHDFNISSGQLTVMKSVLDEYCEYLLQNKR